MGILGNLLPSSSPLNYMELANTQNIYLAVIKS
nr:MAG TPA: hypothetical protein [Caudoviricetes sp.]